MFKIIIVIQLFYAFSITAISYSMPEDSLNYVTSFSDITNSISLESVSSDVQGSLERQTDIPVIELGALIFYSGNMLIDLLLNFAFAIPQMLGMLVNGIMILFNVDGYLFGLVELFSSVLFGVLYIVALIQLLVGVRSGRVT